RGGGAGGGSRVTASAALASASAVSCGRTSAVVVPGRSLGKIPRDRRTPFGDTSQTSSTLMVKSRGGVRLSRSTRRLSATSRSAVIIGRWSLSSSTATCVGALPQDVDAAVADDADEPRHRGAATGVERVLTAPDTDEAVLQDFLGQITSPDNTQREAKQFRRRFRIETMQCRLISARTGLQQCLATLRRPRIGSCRRV